MNRWFVIRLAATALSFWNGLQGGVFALNSSAPSGIAWRIFGIIFGVVLIGGLCAIGSAYKTEEISIDWTKPSWYENPFRLSQPLQLVHFVAVIAIFEGVGDLLRALALSHYERIPQPYMPLGFGLGAWIALRLGVIVFRRKS
jgi:hypothetical protein